MVSCRHQPEREEEGPNEGCMYWVAPDACRDRLGAGSNQRGGERPASRRVRRPVRTADASRSRALSASLIAACAEPIAASIRSNPIHAAFIRTLLFSLRLVPARDHPPRLSAVRTCLSLRTPAMAAEALIRAAAQ